MAQSAAPQPRALKPSETLERWVPRWGILLLVLADAPLLHLLVSADADASEAAGSDAGSLCLTACQGKALRLSLVVHLLVPLGFLARWLGRWAWGLRRRDKETAEHFYNLDRPNSDDTRGRWSQETQLTRASGGKAAVAPLPKPHWNYGHESTESDTGESVAIPAEALELRQQVHSLQSEVGRLQAELRAAQHT